MNKQFDVIGMGNPCVDLLTRVAEIPPAGHSTGVLENSWQSGGKVATALCALSRLGASCAIVGTVGGGVYGQFCQADLADHGVDTSHLECKPESETPFSIVLSDEKSKERTILYHGQRQGQPSDACLDFVRGARILHLETAKPYNLKAALAVREAGGLVSFDADYYVPEMDELTCRTDILIGSAGYYRAVFPTGTLEANMRALRRKGPRLVAFTFGAKGCALLDDDGFSEIEGFSVPVVDTTGAGDVFHGAFLYGILQGWTSVRCARFACATAAIKCTRLGGRAAIPTFDAVETFLRTGVIDDSGFDLRVERYRHPPFENKGGIGF